MGCLKGRDPLGSGLSSGWCGGQHYPFLLPNTAWPCSEAGGSGQEEVKVEHHAPQQATLMIVFRGWGSPESLQSQAPLPPQVDQGSQHARPYWPLAMAILGHVSCQSHHHGHIETSPHGDGECGQEEGPAGGGAGQAEVPLGDGLAGLEREMC